MKSVLDQVVDKIETHVLGEITLFSFENRDIYEITWINMRIACGPPKAANILVHTLV